MKQQDLQSRIIIDQSAQVSHIVIVGGGMVGLALAIMISKSCLDVEVTVIERRHLPKSSAPAITAAWDEKTTALSQGTMDVLKKYEMLSGLMSQCQPINAVHVSDRGHFSGLRLKASDYDCAQLGCVIANRILVDAWIEQAERCSNINILEASEVVECKPVPGAYRLDVDSNGSISHLESDLLIISDGADSSLRQRLHINTLVHDYEQTALVATVELSRDHQGVAYERFTDQGPIALLPLMNCGGSYRAALVWVHANKRICCIQNTSTKVLLHQLQRQLGYRAGHLLRLGSTSYFPLKSVIATEQVRSNLVVVGNASHLLHPVAGQGFNLSVRDIDALLKSLEKTQRIRGKGALGHLQDLQAYQAGRHQDQQATQWATNFIVKTFSSTRIRQSVLRQMGLMALNGIPGVKQLVTSQMMGKLIYQS